VTAAPRHSQDHIKASANDLITVQYIDINCMDTLDAVPTIEPGKRAMLSGVQLRFQHHGLSFESRKRPHSQVDACAMQPQSRE
jgi:hypothetical protein